MNKILKIIGRILIVLLISILFVFITLVATIKLICSDISEGAKECLNML